MPKRGATNSITRFSIDVPAGFRLTERGHHVIAVSADGSRIAFVANDQLNIREMPDTEVRVASARIFGLNTPLFAPDGQWVAFFADGKLQKMPVTGGTPLEICDTPDPFGASWGQDNDILIGGGPNGIQRVSGEGGELKTIATVNAGEVAHGPQMLPDGEHLLFTLATDDVGSERWDHAEVVVQSLTSGHRKVVVHNGSDARYDSSTGNLVYADGSTLRVVPFDVQKLHTTGRPQSIVVGLRRAALDGATGAAQFGMSATGTLAYVRGGVPPPTYRALVLIDMKGVTTVLDIVRGGNFTPRFSADGRRIAWQGGDDNIWILDRTGTTAKRKLTFDGKNAAPVWTHDGRIVFQSSRNGERGLFWQPADGSGRPERLLKTDRPFVDTPTSVSQDGRSLLFLRTLDPTHSQPTSAGQPEGVWLLPLDGNRTPQVLIERRKGDPLHDAPAFSADGRWIVYQTFPVPGIYVEPFPGTGARYPIATDVSWAPMWSPDGNRLVYLSGPNRRFFYAVDILRKAPGVDLAPPRLLFGIEKPLNTFGDGGRIADLSPDGKHIAAIQGVPDQAEKPSTIDIVLNWAADLHARKARRTLTANPPGL